MKRLLRSVIDIDGSITQENLGANYQRLRAAVESDTYKIVHPADVKVFDFVQAYFTNKLELPARQTIEDYYARVNDVEVLERLPDIAACKPYMRSAFSTVLDDESADQARVRFQANLEQAKAIASFNGSILPGEKEPKQGIDAALHYLVEASAPLLSRQSTAKVEGNILQDGEAQWQRYEFAKANQNNCGALTGLNEIDKVFRGLKRGQLWVHAAYTGQLKTSFAITYMYNLVTRYRQNVFYASLEMKWENIRDIVYVMHSNNLRWKGRAPLDYDRVCRGELTPTEEAFYREVIADLSTNPLYGRFEVISPEKEVMISEIKLKAEMMHRAYPVSLIVIDHALLAKAKKSNKDRTAEVTEIVKDAAFLAKHFHGGEGVGVLMLHQLSRTGRKDAEKNDGVYELDALAQAAETERSADIVTTTYLNADHRRDGTTKFACLKTRDGKSFAPFLATVNFACGRHISNRSQFSGALGSGMSVDDARAAIEAFNL